jgi:thioredoxin 1
MKEIIGDECYNVLDSESFIFYYFTASWCGPCQKIYPKIIELEEELKKIDIKEERDKIIFYKIDISNDENEELCNKCNVESVPSFLLFKNRICIDRVIGADIEKIIKIIGKVIKDIL